MNDFPLFYPKYIYWELCNYCNLSCKHCFAKSSPLKSDGVDKNVLMDKIKEIVHDRPAPVPIRFGGGEPMMYPALFEVLEQCRLLGVPVSITTNGTLLDDETAARIKKCNLQSLTISIDGTKEYHEYFRGKNMFELAQRGLVSALQADINVSLSFTLTAWNYKNLFDYITYFHGFGVDRFYIFRYASVTDDETSRRLELNAAILLEVAREIDRIRETFPDVVLIYEKMGFHDFILSKDCSRVNCNFVNGTVTIQYDGSVVVCAAVQKRLANIYHDRLDVVWERVSKEIKTMGEPCVECRGCSFQSVCNGGCKGPSYKNDGSYLHADSCCYKGLC